MSLHDHYARVTPFEIAFPDSAFVDRLVADVGEEAAGRGVDPQLMGAFSTLGSVAAAVRDLRAPDATEEAAHELAALLFHAVHFSRAGKPVYLLRTAATRYLVEGSPDGEPRPPMPAGYLQLPQHLLWMGSGPDAAPQSIDGLFWVASDAGGLHVLPVTGVLPERLVFRVVPLPEAPLRDAAQWLEADVRESGRDFASSLPGHDLDGLYSVEAAGELLKLLARFFAYLDATPTARRESPALPQPRASSGDPGPRPSGLPYHTVSLVD